MSEEQRETAPTKEEFFKLADEWARATGHHSNSHIIMRHPAARKIAAMGETAIPWILLRLSSHHGFFHAHLLEEITGERPYPPQERIGDTGWVACERPTGDRRLEGVGPSKRIASTLPTEEEEIER
jgi:hypothetical protein